MPKFIDKMNLPQYRYFHDTAVNGEKYRRNKRRNNRSLRMVLRWG